jgi:hypothetical protein
MILMVKSRIPHVLFPSSTCFPALSNPQHRTRAQGESLAGLRDEHLTAAVAKVKIAVPRTETNRRWGKTGGNELWLTMVYYG